MHLSVTTRTEQFDMGDVTFVIPGEFRHMLKQRSSE
jgi:hypothetical protein